MAEIRILDPIEERIYKASQTYLNMLWQKFRQGHDQQRLNKMWQDKAAEINNKYKGTKYRIKIEPDALQRAMNGEKSQKVPFGKGGVDFKKPEPPNEKNFIELDI